MGDSQVTHREEMTSPTLYIVHGFPNNCEWLKEKLPRSLARISLPLDLYETQERWARRLAWGRPLELHSILKTLALYVSRA